MVSLSLSHLLPWWQGYWKPLFLHFWHQSKHLGKKEKNKPEGLEFKLNGHGFKDWSLWSLIKSISYLLLTGYTLHLWGCMRHTAPIAIASGASAFRPELHTVCHECTLCSTYKCQEVTTWEGACGINTFFFFLMSIYMHHYLLCPFCGVSAVTVAYCSCCNEGCKFLGKVACIPWISEQKLF